MRHLQGLKGGELLYGLSNHGEIFGVGGMFYMLDDNSIRVHGSFEQSEIVDIALQRYVLDISYAYTPIDISGFAFVNLLAGVTANYSMGKFFERQSPDEGINVGALAGLELEAFVAGMVSFFIKVDQRVHVYDNYGRWRNYSQVGLRVGFK